MDKKNSITLPDLAFKFVPIQATLMTGLLIFANWLAGTEETSEARLAAVVVWAITQAVGWVMIFPVYLAKNFKVEIEVNRDSKTNEQERQDPRAP
jgi:hypothetical protein